MRSLDFSSCPQRTMVSANHSSTSCGVCRRLEDPADPLHASCWWWSTSLGITTTWLPQVQTPKRPPTRALKLGDHTLLERLSRVQSRITSVCQIASIPSSEQQLFDALPAWPLELFACDDLILLATEAAPCVATCSGGMRDRQDETDADAAETSQKYQSLLKITESEKTRIRRIGSMVNGHWTLGDVTGRKNPQNLEGMFGWNTAREDSWCVVSGCTWLKRSTGSRRSTAGNDSR